VTALREDIRHALRLYRRTPGASLGVVAVLAIGMAFVAAFLSMYADLILRPERGFEAGKRIVTVNWYDGRNSGQLPLALVERMSKEATAFEHVAGAVRTTFRVGPEKASAGGELVTRDFFPGIRPRLALGNGFSAADHDEQGAPVVVISWRYWQEKFDGHPDVIGKTMLIGVMANPFAPAAAGEKTEENFRIVGVMDRAFESLEPPTQARNGWTAFWIPVERALALQPAAQRAQMSNGLALRTVARRADGVSNRAAARQLKGSLPLSDFMRRVGAEYDVADGIVQDVLVRRETQRQLQLFLGASVLLALVAAANVSLFLLARAPGRRSELGIRMAVGASMRRLARQLLHEAAVLVAVAAVLGLALSVWLSHLLRALPFLRQAQWRDVTLLDWRVLALVGTFLLLVTLLVSLAPVAGLRRMGIAASSRLVAARATIGQRIAGTLQIAVAGVLGGAAIAFAWYLASLLLAYPGYKTRNLYAVPYAMAFRVTMTNGVASTQGGIVENARKREAFLALPGISAVSLAAAVPGVQSPNTGDGMSTLPDPATPGQVVRIRSVAIDPYYVGMLGLKILHGRNLDEGDLGGALVNQAFARRFFGREDIAGEPMPGAAAQAASRNSRSQQPTQIIGVIEDFPFDRPLAGTEPLILSGVSSATGGVVLVESALPQSSFQKQIQDAGGKLELNLMGNIVPLAKARNDILAPDRARGLLTISAASIVVLLAAFGFYGTQRYLVMAGRREYAIRASVGATPRALGRLVLRRGLILALPGTVLAVPLGILMVSWLRDYYIPRDISPYVVAIAAVGGLFALALVASLGPSGIARRTQPALLLREG